MSHNHTVTELKDFLQVRNLSLTDIKAELINRPEQFDADIWEMTVEEKLREAERSTRDEETRKRDGTERTEALFLQTNENNRGRLNDEFRQLNDSLPRKEELLKRERDVL
ncbi:hypothetical protein ANTQUA_LOCUS10403 [Anthophora quadrimaculata]